MAIDFTLTAEQRALQKTAREFAQEVLKPVVAEADALTDTQQAFVMMKGRLQGSLQARLRHGIPTKGIWRW